MKKHYLLAVLPFCLTSFDHQAISAASTYQEATTKSTWSKITTLLTVCSLYIYRGATQSTPTVHAFGGTENDQWWHVATTQNDGSVAVGESFSYGLGDHSKGVMAEYNALGDLTWYASFGGKRSESIKAVGTLGDLYVMTGDTTSFGGISQDMFTTVYDPTSASWVSTQVKGGNSKEGGVAVAVHEDGSYLIGGYTWQKGHADIVLTRFFANHTEAWSRTIDGGGDDHLAAITTVNHVYVIVGTTTSGDAEGQDLLIFAINKLGTITWSGILGGMGNEAGYAAKTTSDEDILVTGYTTEGTGKESVLWAKFNRTGGLLYAQAIGFLGTEIGYSLALGSDGRAFITGSTDSYDFGHKNMFVFYMDEQVLQEAFTIGGQYHDIGYGLTLNKGYLTLVGSTLNGHIGGQNMLLARLLANDTGTCRTDITPTVTALTNTLSWRNISLNNSLSTLPTQTVTWHTYTLILEETAICTPTLSPTSTPIIMTTPLPSAPPSWSEGPKVRVIYIDPINIEVKDRFVYFMGNLFEGQALKIMATQQGQATLPRWLHVNTTSHLLWGRATNIGSYPIKLTAEDLYNRSVNLFFTINVRDPWADPGIQQADYAKIFAPLVAALVALVCGAYFCQKHKHKKELNFFKKHPKKTDELAPSNVELTFHDQSTIAV